MTVRNQDKDGDHANGDTPLPAVSANTLARCLGVTPKVIYDLAKAGVIGRGSGRLATFRSKRTLGIWRGARMERERHSPAQSDPATTRVALAAVGKLAVEAGE
jgi:hypothetical protein